MYNNGSTKLYNVLMGNPSGNAVNNAIGRYAGQSFSTPQQSGNLLENAITGFGENIKNRARAGENAIATSLAAPISGINDARTNLNRDFAMGDNKFRMNEVARKYGYNTYQDVWDARDAAEAAGDTETLNKIDNVINPELQAQATENKNKMDDFAADYNDYRKNDYISRKINQDQGKFAGDALTTLSTAADVAAMTTGLPMGVGLNALQGGVEGVANELSQNGFENFDLGRAAQNALIGAASGAATAGLNSALPGARQGGLIRNVASGAGRGALSGTVGGAVGGALGGGMNAAINKQDVGSGILQGLAQGAAQGATSGAVSGGIMGGVNTLGNKAINALDKKYGTNFGEISQAGRKWQESGDTFDERLTNTLNSGESAVGNWINGRQSKLLNTVGGIGNTIQTNVPEAYHSVDPLGNRTEYTPQELAQLIKEYDNYKAPDTITGNSTDEITDAIGDAGDKLLGIYSTMTGTDYIDNAYNKDSWKGFEDWLNTQRQDPPTTAGGWLKKAGQRLVDDLNNKGVGLSLNKVDSATDTNTQGVDAWDRIAQQQGYDNYDQVIQRYLEANPDVELNPRGAAGQILTWLDENPNTPTTLGGWAKRAGERVVDDLNNKGAGLSIKKFNNDYNDFVNDKNVQNRLMQSIEAQAYENPNAKVGDTNIDYDGIISEYTDKLTPEQYAKFNQAEAENALMQKTQQLENQLFTLDRSQRDYTPGIDRVTRAFDESSNQKVLTSRGGNEFSLGDFGRNNLQRKTSSNHNLSESDIVNVLNTSDKQSIAGDSSFRKDNTAWFGDLPDGSRATVITRQNALGQQEVINAYKNNPGYEAELINKYGTPAQSRTGNLALEEPGVESATRGANTIIPQNDKNGNPIPEDIASMRINRNDMLDTSVESPETELYRQLTGNANRSAQTITAQPDDTNIRNELAVADENPLEQVFDNKIGKIQKQNKAQAIGKAIENAGEGVTYSEVYDALDPKTATRAQKTKAVQKLSKMGVKPRDYEEYAKTSSYVNQVASELASKSNVKVVDPDLATKLLPANLDVNLTDDAAKTYNNYIKQIVADGANPDEYTAGYLLEKTRWLGDKAQKVGGKDAKDIRQALTAAKWVIRDEVSDAMAKNNITGGNTTELIAQGLKDMGANDKVIEYYTAPGKDGKSPNISELINRSSLFEQARDMGTQIGAEAMTRSASKYPAGSLKSILRAGGVDQLANLAAKQIVAPITGGVMKVAGKGISAVGNAAAKIGSGDNTSTPQTQVYDLLNRNNTLNIIGREAGLEAGGANKPAGEYIAQASAEQGYVAPLGATTTTAPTTLESLTSTNTVGTTTPTTLASALGNSQSTTNNTTTSATTPNYAYTDIIAGAMERAAAAGDADAFATLYGMYNDAVAELQSQSDNSSNLSATQQTQLAKFDSAEDAINELEDLYNQAGGGKGAVLGWLQERGADLTLDSNARTYRQMAEGLVNQVAQAIGKTDSLNTEGEVKRALQLIPSLTDDAQTARNKLKTLRQMLEQTKANYYNAYGVAY